jgi:hypothetical protein
MKNEILTKNQGFVNANLPMFLSLYKNKYILVYDQEVVGSFDSYEAAAEEGISVFGIGESFLVHYVTENSPVNFISVAIL